MIRAYPVTVVITKQYVVVRNAAPYHLPAEVLRDIERDIARGDLDSSLVHVTETMGHGPVQDITMLAEE